MKNNQIKIKIKDFKQAVESISHHIHTVEFTIFRSELIIEAVGLIGDENMFIQKVVPLEFKFTSPSEKNIILDKHKARGILKLDKDFILDFENKTVVCDTIVISQANFDRSYYPQEDIYITSFSLPQVIKDNITKIINMADTNGVLFDLNTKEKNLNIVGTDSKILGRLSTQVNINNIDIEAENNIKTILSAKLLKIIDWALVYGVKIYSKSVTLECFNNVTYHIDTMAGTYPRYNNILQPICKAPDILKINTKLFLEVVNKAIKVGENSVDIEIVTNNKHSVKIYADAEYLQKALAHSSEVAKIIFCDNNSPFIISDENKNIRVAVIPMPILYGTE